MIIEIEIMIFLENRIESILQFLEQVWLDSDTDITVSLEVPAIGAGGHRMGFTPPPPRVRSRWVWRSLYFRRSDHAECGGVYIFNSEYWGEEIEITP